MFIDRMLRSFLVVILFTSSLTEGYDFFPINLHRCQTIPSNFSLCYGLGYTQMYLPNLLNHESVTEILYELPLWQSLLTLGCHSNARLLLCSILAPVCIQQTPEKASTLVSFDNNNNQDSLPMINSNNKKFLYPCRSLCESVKQSCESKMISQFGYKWPTMIACDQYPDETDLCVSHSTTSSTMTTTTVTTTMPITTLRPSIDFCSMCQSRASINELLQDYCRASTVLRTRPVKISSQSEKHLLFADKHKVRYFKRMNSTNIQTMKWSFPLRSCSCVKLQTPTILFISSNGELIRFISIQHNPRVFKRFRNTIVLRKPRCQHHLSS